MSETLKQILIWVGTALSSISLTSVINFISISIRMSRIKKWIEKNNQQETARQIGNEAAKLAVEQIKEISFKQNIQPIAESELEKVNEKSIAFIEKSLKDTNENYNKLLKVFESFAKYFDNSFGVPDEVKQEFKNALNEAKIKPQPNNTIEVEEIVVKEQKATENPKSRVRISR